MKKEKVNKLKFGVYRIFWKKKKGGGSSVGAVGYNHAGERWMMCSNWIGDPSLDWTVVKRVELIGTQENEFYNQYGEIRGNVILFD